MSPEERLLADPPATGLFVDYDGTLAPIVADPARAGPLEGAREVLAALSRRFGVVAVVSGRSAAELVRWLDGTAEIWGVHGAERAHRGRVELSECLAPHRARMRSALERARAAIAALGHEGLVVEDKGVVVTLHYRRAPEVRSEVLEVARSVADSLGLAMAEGKASVELRPPVELSKAAVVLERARAAQLRAAAFVGDDAVDLAGFDALDELEREGVAGVRVAVASPEAPEELLRRADVVVEGPAGALAWLASLAGLS